MKLLGSRDGDRAAHPHSGSRGGWPIPRQQEASKKLLSPLILIAFASGTYGVLGLHPPTTTTTIFHRALIQEKIM